MADAQQFTGPAQAPDDRRIELPALSAKSEQQQEPPPLPWAPGQRVGFAMVGLGHLSFEQLLPAFGEARRARLVALVSGAPEKARAVAAAHGIAAESIYDYAAFDRIRDDRAIEAVYVALPNSDVAQIAAHGRVDIRVPSRDPRRRHVDDGHQSISASGFALFMRRRTSTDDASAILSPIPSAIPHGRRSSAGAPGVRDRSDPSARRRSALVVRQSDVR
jgi:hypothetical protein